MLTLFLRSRRLGFLLGALVAAGLIGFALYLQYQLDEDPCPLCIFQRVAVIATGLFFLLGSLIGGSRLGARLSAGLAILASSVGGLVAIRHIWIQHLPEDQIPACGPGLSYLMDTFPVADVIKKVLSGSGECAHIGWTFLGFSIPQLTLFWFVAFILWAVYLYRR